MISGQQCIANRLRLLYKTDTQGSATVATSGECAQLMNSPALPVISRWILPTLLISLALLLSCAEKTAAPATHQVFKRQAWRMFKKMQDLAAPAFDAADPANAMDRAIQRFLTEAATDPPVGFTVAVLDDRMRFLAGRILETSGDIRTYPSNLDDYRYLKDEFSGIETGDIVQNILYHQTGTLYVLSKAVLKDQTVQGFIFIAFHGEEFTEKWGFSEEIFRRIDFSHP